MAKKKKKFHKKRDSNSLTKKDIKRYVINKCNGEPTKTYTYKIFADLLKIKDFGTKRLINAVLLELAHDGYLNEIQRGKFKLHTKGGHIVGVVDLTQKGHAYVVSEESEQDIFVSASNLNHALNGDKVKVMLYAARKKRAPEGEVVEIIERAKTKFVGTIQRSRNYSFLVPDGNNHFDIFIPNEKLKDAEDGVKAVVKLTEWPKNAKNPFGEVIDILGMPGDNDTEMHSILAEYELPYKFPDNVELAAQKLPVEITEEEIEKRRDFRKVQTLTIDPADAKDFDDALSYQLLENGNIEIGVHIADVTHYVRPKTIIEDEACERATSVYLVDRVVPMLPENLSNGVCSLRPNEEKLTFSAVFELTDKAEIVNQWFGRTVIYSDRRLTYAEAQEVIETGEGEMSEAILAMNGLARKLRAKRYKSGAIDFDRVEVKFEIDENGKPLSVFFKEAKESNQLIEEFMLLANKKVAEFIGKQEGRKTPKTFVYRIHDRPDPEKLESFNQFISKFGYGIQMDSPRNISKSLNNLLQNVKGSKESNVVETLAIRSMAKATYSTRNIGHYGLAFDYYSHFTSPIRRYPDMMVHRLLAKYLDGGRSVTEEKYEDLCRHASVMEQRAAKAERSSIKYKQVEFMKEHVGEEFDGLISGVTDWGIYVELNESKCEGMVSMRDLEGDFYSFDEKNYCIVGEHTNKKYTLGDPVRIQILRANLERKQLDFTLVDSDES